MSEDMVELLITASPVGPLEDAEIKQGNGRQQALEALIERNLMERGIDGRAHLTFAGQAAAAYYHLDSTIESIHQGTAANTTTGELAVVRERVEILMNETEISDEPLEVS